MQQIVLKGDLLRVSRICEALGTYPSPLLGRVSLVPEVRASLNTQGIQPLAIFVVPQE